MTVASRSSRMATGWPVLAGLVAFALGLLLLGGAGFFYRQAYRLVESTAQVPPEQARPANSPAALPAADSAALQMPAYATHLDDIGLLFELAKEQGVSLGPITYRSDVNASVPVVVRMLELRLDEEYPKLKAFVAELLRRMPHLYLEEIRVEQGAAATSKAQATLKLSFVYQGGKGPSK